MTRACAQETNKLGKKAGRCFSSCSPLPSSSTQSFQSCCIATAKWCKIFLTSRLFIWPYCGVNILTIRRFYSLLRSRFFGPSRNAPPKRRGERCVTAQKTAAKVTIDSTVLYLRIFDQWWKLRRMEANSSQSSCPILRTFVCVGYKESEEHIFI